VGVAGEPFHGVDLALEPLAVAPGSEGGMIDLDGRLVVRRRDAPSKMDSRLPAGVVQPAHQGVSGDTESAVHSRRLRENI
jgi:hypothetical protein